MATQDPPEPTERPVANVGPAPTSSSVRTAREVIDTAISENKFGERLLYGFAIVFALTGIVAIVWGIIKGDALTTLAGAVASSLFWPAMNSARRTRKENLAIRLLEAPLSRADTAREAADTLRQTFDDIFRDKTKDG